MENLNPPSNPGTKMTMEPKKLLASPRHTMTLFGIVTILLAGGVMNSANNLTASHAPQAGQMVLNDLIMIGMLWFWVYFIYRGMKDHGHSILEFLGLESFTFNQLISDCLYAVVAFALICAGEIVVKLLVPDHSSQSNNPLFSSRLNGWFEIAVWLVLSCSAGICEEIVFRGYLQRQLALMTGNAGIAILVQGVIFGIGHAYEGTSAVAGIVLHGVVLGILAKWRGNIRAGMIEHAGWDIVAGFGLIGANW